MEIYYFGINGEKVGPVTKEELVNLAKAGVVTEQTALEINGKKVKGNHIKNLLPIFETQKGNKQTRIVDSIDTKADVVPPPVVIETTNAKQNANTKSDNTEERYNQTTQFWLDQYAGKNEAKSNDRVLNPIEIRYQNLKIERKEAEVRQQLRPYAKFQWCYRIIMTLLHISFVAGMIFLSTVLVKGLKLKNNAEKCYWSLVGEISDYTSLVTFQALGWSIEYEFERVKTTEESKIRRREVWEKAEEFGIDKTAFNQIVASMERKLNSDYESETKKLNNHTPAETLHEKGEKLDTIVEARRSTAKWDKEILYNLEDIISPANEYEEYVTEKLKKLEAEGRNQATECGKLICYLLGSYLCLLIPYYFMAAIVCSAKNNHKTMLLIEEALKSKNNQEDKGAGGIL